MTITATEIEQIIARFETSEFDEISLRVGDTHLRVVRKGAGGGGAAGGTTERVNVGSEGTGTSGGTPLPAPAQAPAAQGAGGAVADRATEVRAQGEGHLVRADIGGIFYHASSPGADPFVSRGDTVAADDTVGLIEVMKLFTSVTAGVAGEVVEFLAENGAHVAKGDALMRIRKAD